MILQVATPAKLPTRWRNYIQLHHETEFGYRMENIHDHWWYVETNGGQVAGFAGMKRETFDCVFIGPCIINADFRRQVATEAYQTQGIQGEEDGIRGGPVLHSLQKLHECQQLYQVRLCHHETVVRGST